jgi:hypothetical protein
VPIYDFAIANEELANEDTEEDYPCCGPGRAFVQGASTPFVSLETLASVLFVMRTKVAKQMKEWLRK